MIITLWILAIVFGAISIALFIKFFRYSLSGGWEVVLMVFSVLIFAFVVGGLYEGVGTIVDIGQ